MKIFLFYISIFILPLFVVSQSNPQQEYLDSKPQQHEFNSKHWKKIKKTMLREARGNGKANGENFNSKDFQGNSQNPSYYDYQEETFDGEYAKNNGERSDDYDYEEEHVNYKEGEGSNYYKSKERDLETGEYYSKNREQNYSESRPRSNSSDSSYNPEGMGTFTSILLYTLLAVFLGYIIYVLFVNTTISDKGAKVKEVELEKAPVEISKSELEIMLEKALANNDYRLAVRIYFIFILKDLSEKNWITWKKEKTNISYLMEMRGKKQYELFNESVSIFELVWYGNYTISKNDYTSIEPKLKTLLQELANNK